ncbi:MAG: hypothetical protein PWP09_1242 [Thermotogota bacterium]|nr:hypothetical protein [Thermotogota bacterium]
MKNSVVFLLFIILFSVVVQSQEIKIEISVILKPEVEAHPPLPVSVKSIAVGFYETRKNYVLSERIFQARIPVRRIFPFVIEELHFSVNYFFEHLPQPQVKTFYLKKESFKSTGTFSLLPEQRKRVFPFISMNMKKPVEAGDFGKLRSSSFLSTIDSEMFLEKVRKFDLSRLKRVPVVLSSEAEKRVPVMFSLLEKGSLVVFSKEVKPVKKVRTVHRFEGFTTYSKQVLLSELLAEVPRPLKPSVIYGYLLSKKSVSPASVEGIVYRSLEEERGSEKKMILSEKSIFEVSRSLIGMRLGMVGADIQYNHLFFELSHPQFRIVLSSNYGMEFTKEIGNTTLGVALVQTSGTLKLLPAFEAFKSLGSFKFLIGTGLDAHGYEKWFGVTTGSVTLKYIQDNIVLMFERVSLLWNGGLLGISFYSSFGKVGFEQFLGYDGLRLTLSIPIFHTVFSLTTEMGAEGLELVGCRWSTM